MLLLRMHRIHYKCRNGIYPFSQLERFPVDDVVVDWNREYKKYSPPDYTSAAVLGKPWADPDLSNSKFKPKFNALDDKIDRRSRLGIYSIVNGRPRNPEGRTGVKGRGILGRWGPNHAADPVVTRWKRSKGYIVLHDTSKLPILQFCSIKRKDTGEWAIPGGMVDPGETISATLRREFTEEAMNSLERSENEKNILHNMVEKFFANGKEVYAGYVDDHRNTDNAWMETVVYNFHDDSGESVGKFPLEAGDDAGKVKWMDVDGTVNLYASHSDFLRSIAKLHKAHF